MPTPKQIQYVKNRTLDKLGTEGDIIRRSGYSDTVARTPALVRDTQGVQELLAQAQDIEGLDDKSVLNYIASSIKAQGKRGKADYALKWLDLVYKTSNKSVTDNRKVTVNPDIDKLDKQAHIYISQKYNITVQELKKRLKH